MQTTATPLNQNARINKQARDQLVGLSLMFLLGMGVNLIGLPSEVTGTANLATSIILSVHVLIGLGLLAGAAVTLRRTRGSHFTKNARIGLIAIILTIFCGVMTATTKSNWWSYGMSIGFLANIWLYGWLYINTRK